GVGRRPGGGLASPPAASISPTPGSGGGLRRPTTITRAPSAASSLAVSRPMPVPPPVTIATCPSSCPMPTSGPLRSAQPGEVLLDEVAADALDVRLGEAPRDRPGHGAVGDARAVERAHAADAEAGPG